MMEDYFAESRSEWEEVVKDLDLQPNPAIKMYSKVESRPYTEDDFVRREFHRNLIAQD